MIVCRVRATAICVVKNPEKAATAEGKFDAEHAAPIFRNLNCTGLRNQPTNECVWKHGKTGNYITCPGHGRHVGLKGLDKAFSWKALRAVKSAETGTRDESLCRFHHIGTYGKKKDLRGCA